MGRSQAEERKLVENEEITVICSYCDDWIIFLRY